MTEVAGTGMQCGTGAAKGRTEFIPDGLEDIAIPGLDGLAQDAVMLVQSAAHEKGVFFPETGAPFDIGEEKGDLAGRDHGLKYTGFWGESEDSKMRIADIRASASAFASHAGHLSHLPVKSGF